MPLQQVAEKQQRGRDTISTDPALTAYRLRCVFRASKAALLLTL